MRVARRPRFPINLPQRWAPVGDRAAPQRLTQTAPSTLLPHADLPRFDSTLQSPLSYPRYLHAFSIGARFCETVSD